MKNKADWLLKIKNKPKELLEKTQKYFSKLTWGSVEKLAVKTGKHFVLWLWTMMWRMVKRLFIYAIFLFFVFKAFFSPARYVMPSQAVLFYDLTQEVTESEKGYLFREFLRNQQYNLRDLLRSITLAAKDERVKALVVKGADKFISFAAAEELREAVKEFKQTGKRAIFLTADFGDVMTPNLSAYYLASSFSEIWLARSGEVNLSGIYLQQPYFKETFAKLGITPEFLNKYEYKSGPENFTQSKMSKPVRENMNELMKNFLTQFESGVAEARHLPLAKFQNIARKTPISATKALELGLVDRIGYEADLEKELIAQFPDTERVEGYFYEPKVNKMGNKTIAIVYADGVIMDNETETEISENFVIPSTFYDLLDEVNEEKIDGVLLRVNSPGGSYAPSDEILDIMDKIAQKIPVVVSMSDVAASGGYMISLAADKIFASDSTITGSIGVYGGKFTGAGLMEKLGISFDEILLGSQVLKLQSVVETMNALSHQKFDESMENVYQSFVSLVSKYRGMSKNKLDKLARGRVFSGYEAKKVGLVDEIGGFNEALKALKKMLKIDEDAAVAAMILTTTKDKIDRIISSFLYNNSLGGASDLQKITQKFKIWQAMMKADMRLLAPYDLGRL